MARTLKIKTSLGSVTGKLSMPQTPRRTGVVLAHGAGAGQSHPWMVGMRDRLTAFGFPTLTFNYLYTEWGRKAPDRLPKLIEVHTAAANRLATYTDDVVLAGKSMGGRVGGHVVADAGFPAVGLVYFGYPIVAMGKTTPRNTEHLAAVAAPQLFISGTRDPMGPSDLVEAVAASVPNGSYAPIADGDHSLVPRKSTGRTLEDSLDLACEIVDAWWISEINQ
ncbi:MAG: hypothetical protein M5U23_08990 [Acidimicrobiia bacterium]|nr:hypothetical protein [Acidimicrobiia bacterium]